MEGWPLRLTINTILAFVWFKVGLFSLRLTEISKLRIAIEIKNSPSKPMGLAKCSSNFTGLTVLSI